MTKQEILSAAKEFISNSDDTDPDEYYYTEKNARSEVLKDFLNYIKIKGDLDD